MNDSMRRVIVVAAATIWLTGCRDQRVTDLEKRVSGLEADRQVQALRASC